MKPSIEKVSDSPQLEWLVKHYQCNHSEFDWHYHLEYGVVLQRNCIGQLFAGDYSGPFGQDTLMMFGPHLAHTTTICEILPGESNNDAYVLWFSQQWIDSVINSFSELRSLNKLLTQSQRGIIFSQHTAQQVFQLLQRAIPLSKARQALAVIDVLCVMQQASERQFLNAVSLTPLVHDAAQRDRIERATRFIANHYQQPITVDDLCQQLHLSSSSVYRLFEQHVGDSFAEHLKKYRIGKACEYLINTDHAVSMIAQLTGFNNLSNFNRQFRALKQQTPRQFRALYANARPAVKRA